MARRPTVLLSFVAGALVACGGPRSGTDVGNGRTLSMDLTGYEDTSSYTPQSLTLDSGVLIESALIAVERIRFEPLVGESCEDEGDDTEIDIDGPIVAELAGAGVLGATPAFDTTDGSFCGLEVGFHRIDLADAPPTTPSALDGLSIRLEGERADGVAFVVESDVGETFELEGKEDRAFTLSPGTHEFFLAYELSSWIAALELDTLGPGPIVVSEAQNADRLDAFEEAVKASARLFLDENADGELSTTERMAGTELAD